MSESSGSPMTCPMCAKDCPSREEMKVHHMRHLGYKKYACGSCSSMYYTEQEREDHCRSKKHLHTFEVRVNQYNEMLMSQLMKDTEYLAVYDTDFIIMQRAKANLDFDKAVLESDPKEAARGRRMSRSRARSPERRRSVSAPRKRSSTSVTRSRQNSIRSPESSNDSKAAASSSPLTPTSGGLLGQRVMNVARVAMPYEDWTKISEDPTPSRSHSSGDLVSRDTALIADALRSEIVELKCKLCKKKVPAGYVERKQHVSTAHMTADHTASDFVDILEAKMRTAFPGHFNSDLQCQLNGCGKVYNSKSGRRTHVMRVHLTSELKCPIEGCNFGSTDAARLRQHAKDDHGLPDGYRKMNNTAARYKYECDKREHNSKLDALCRKAFPCALPESIRSEPAETTTKAVSSVIESLRNMDRSSKPHPAPPRSYRPRSSSGSSTSSDQSRSEEAAHSSTEDSSQSEEKANGSKDETDKEKRREEKKRIKEEEEQKNREKEETQRRKEEKRREKERAEEEKQRKREREEEDREREERKRKKHRVSEDEVKHVVYEMEEDEKPEIIVACEDDDIIHIASIPAKTKRKRKESTEAKTAVDLQSFPSQASSRASSVCSMSVCSEDLKEEQKTEEGNEPNVSTAPSRKRILLDDDEPVEVPRAESSNAKRILLETASEASGRRETYEGNARNPGHRFDDVESPSYAQLKSCKNKIKNGETLKNEPGILSQLDIINIEKLIESKLAVQVLKGDKALEKMSDIQFMIAKKCFQVILDENQRLGRKKLTIGQEHYCKWLVNRAFRESSMVEGIGESLDTKRIRKYWDNVWREKEMPSKVDLLKIRAKLKYELSLDDEPARFRALTLDSIYQLLRIHNSMAILDGHAKPFVEYLDYLYEAIRKKYRRFKEESQNGELTFEQQRICHNLLVQAGRITKKFRKDGPVPYGYG